MDKMFSILFFVLLLLSFLPRIKALGAQRVINYSVTWILIFILIGIVYVIKNNSSGIGGQFISALIPSHISKQDNKLTIAKSMDGHFHVDVTFNGIALNALIDTGASEVVVPASIANKARLPVTSEFIKFQTANGVIEAYKSRANISFGGVEFKNFPVYVQNTEGAQALIGMSLLEKFDQFTFDQEHLYLYIEPIQ